MRARTAIEGCALFAGSLCASAQQPEVLPARYERIEVTGTHIPRVEVEGALPLQIITRDEMERGGIETAQDLLDRISAHQSYGGFTEASGVGVVVPANGWGYTAASLRGLGSQRTLVLLDGRRLAPYALSGSAPVDLSAIPVAALDRVEVLKDGASAVYGTDAIGGVINFILRRDFRGIEASGAYFKTQHGGGDSWRAGLAAGFGDIDRDGHSLFINLQHQRQAVLKEADRESTRTGFRRDLSLLLVSGNSFPANISQPGRFGLRNPTIPPGGPTAASCFPPYSSALPEYPIACLYDTPLHVDAIPASERSQVIGRFEQRLGASDRLFVEAIYYHGYSIQNVAPTPVNSNSTSTLMTLAPSSAYYPTDFVRQSGGDPTKPVRLAYRTVELGNRVDEIRMDQGRATAGLQGSRAGWDYEAALNYSANRQVPYAKSGYLSEAAFGPLLRSGVINPFGPNTPEVLAQMRAAQITGQESDNRATQYGGDLKASRDVMALPAGAVTVAIGIEGRKETLEMTNAPFTYTGDVIGGNGALPSFSTNTRKVGSLFAEANVPISRSLETDVAVRADHYSDFGTTVNPKFTLKWTVSKQWLARASYGTGFRAPTLYDLYLPTYFYYQDLLDVKDPVRCPVTHAYEDCHADIRKVAGGNPQLEPEKSRQLNVGLVFEPTPGFSASSDYYRVRLSNVIGGVSDDTLLAAYAVRKPPEEQYPGLPGPIDYVVAIARNVGSLDTSGLDIDSRWRIARPAGRLTLSLTGTYVLTFHPDDIQGGVPSAGHRSAGKGVGAISRWRHYAAAEWSHGFWDLTLAQNFQAGYYETDLASCDNRGVCLGQRRVGSYSVLDLQGRFTGLRHTTLALGVRNLLDRAPPATNQAGGAFQVGIDPSYADPRGRTWYASLRWALR